MNGVEVNKIYDGRPQWRIGRLNDVLRNREYSVDLKNREVPLAELMVYKFYLENILYKKD